MQSYFPPNSHNGGLSHTSHARPTAMASNIVPVITRISLSSLMTRTEPGGRQLLECR